MSLLLKVLLFVIIGGMFLIFLILLLDGLIYKLPEGSPLRKWWENHICGRIEEDDDYDSY